MDAASEELLDTPATQGPPSPTASFPDRELLAFHETYHVGQTAYLRCWLGHTGPMG